MARGAAPHLLTGGPYTVRLPIADLVGWSLWPNRLVSTHIGSGLF